MQRLKNEERERAVERGVNFIYRIARNRKSFRSCGPYFTCFFVITASTSRNVWLRREAREMGRNLALRWRAANPALPINADLETIGKFVIAAYAADRSGFRDKALKEQIREAVKRLSVQELLGFDPTTEPPPNDYPKPCVCGVENPRGRKSCNKCKKRLRMSSQYEVWSEALCTTYWGERYGVRLGARYADVLKWLPQLRPYLGRKKSSYSHFFDLSYAVTHVVYTLNDYGRYNISPRWLPNEYSFLKANLKEAIDLDDPDMVGEFIDSLKSFGLSDDHPVIRPGINYLLSKQNPDGSWGDPDEEDVYCRFHATWTAIDALREYAWRGERLSYPMLMPLLKRPAKSR